MTPSQYLDGVLEQVTLKLDDKERALIEAKHNKLREELRGKLDLVDDFLTGSYRRHTIIKPKGPQDKFDVDFFVCFAGEQHDTTDLDTLRELVFDALLDIKLTNQALGISEVRNDQRRSVGVTFGRNFQIDVVPSIEILKDKQYIIWDRKTLLPVSSNPQKHGELLTKANEQSNGKLVPLIRMLKGWKREKCDFVKSYHVELLATNVLASPDILSTSTGLHDFFAKGAARLESGPLFDPANDSNPVDSYLDEDSQRRVLIELFERDAELAKNAIDIEAAGDEESAIELWRMVFESKADNGDGNRSRARRPVAVTPQKPYSA